MKHILLIDDDEDDRDFFLSVIDVLDPSITCRSEENGLAAMQFLSQSPELPDLIFLDLNMPIMNGRQFLLQIKKDDRFKNIPVIVLSTSADKATILESKKLGAIDFITKPNKLSILETKVREILNNSSYLIKQ